MVHYRITMWHQAKQQINKNDKQKIKVKTQIFVAVTKEHYDLRANSTRNMIVNDIYLKNNCKKKKNIENTQKNIENEENEVIL